MAKVLTGRQRYREHRTLFGRKLLVLQVEEAWIESSRSDPGFPDEACTGWRDAKPEDLMLHTSKGDARGK